jgi:hypothetical protein
LLEEEFWETTPKERHVNGSLVMDYPTTQKDATMKMFIPRRHKELGIIGVEKKNQIIR